MSRNEKSDDCEIKYICTQRSDGKVYDLTVVCDEQLTDEDFGDCLLELAKDIYMGKFTFANEDKVEVFSAQ